MGWKDRLKEDQLWLIMALAATYLWGLAAHGYAFFDNNLSHDSLREFHAEILGNDIKMSIGRVLTPIYRDLLGSDVTLPWFSGVLALLPRDACYYFTQASVKRALPAPQVRELAAARGLAGEAYPDVEAALQAAKSAASPEDFIFVGGSSFIVADLLVFYTKNGYFS